jgi:hypothetical protein
LNIRTKLILKISAAFVIFTLVLFVTCRKTIGRWLPYFDNRCLEYRQKDYSRKLNDRINVYSAEAKRKGIVACKDDNDLNNRIAQGKLVKVKSCTHYLVEDMDYGSPYLTGESKALLAEIAERFRKKVSEKGLKGVRIIVTSMTRKTEVIKSLRLSNVNSSVNSPHLYGNAFDISYKRFRVRKFSLTNCDGKYLKDALGEVIYQLREENKCWATYERMQNCFHVVAR